MAQEPEDITPWSGRERPDCSAKNARSIGEADPGLGMTAHSISAADSGEALEEKII
ncbi:hypothetical protein [Streptomyces globosus]|uniref:hypothetical protein n=1 Tax=Streptomyces globosus TaxID=68209 RepID=UPI0013B36EF2|nr:hypothetical protein [Streptomyces globosus]